FFSTRGAAPGVDTLSLHDALPISADRVHDGDVRPEHLHLVDAAGQAGAVHPLVEQLLVEGLDRRPALEAAPVEGDQLAVLREGRGQAGAAPLVPSGDELVVQGTAGGLVVDGHDEPPLSSCARRRATFAHPNSTVTYRHGQYGTGARPSANAPTVGVCRASSTAGAPPPPSAPPRTAATGWCATPTGSCSGPSTWRRRRRSCSAGSARSRWRPTATTGSTTGAAPAARRRRPRDDAQAAPHPEGAGRAGRGRRLTGASPASARWIRSTSCDCSGVIGRAGARCRCRRRHRWRRSAGGAGGGPSRRGGRAAG